MVLGINIQDELRNPTNTAIKAKDIVAMNNIINTMIASELVAISRGLNGKIMRALAITRVTGRKPKAIQEVTKQTEVRGRRFGRHPNVANEIAPISESGDIAINSENDGETTTIDKTTLSNFI